MTIPLILQDYHRRYFCIYSCSGPKLIIGRDTKLFVMANCEAENMFPRQQKLDQGTWLCWTLLDNFLIDFDLIGQYLTNLDLYVCLDFFIWTRLFGRVYLDLSIGTFLYGPVYWDMFLWPHLFGPVYLRWMKVSKKSKRNHNSIKTGPNRQAQIDRSK